MLLRSRPFLEVRELEREWVESFLQRARCIDFKNPSHSLSRCLIGLVFLEPSTRTRCSFEVAALRLGAKVFNLEANESSVQKGETVFDTLANLSAMGPDILVVRHGANESLKDIASKLNVPIINAGEGISGHPTQALLDLYAIWEARSFPALSSLKEKVVFIGDVAHSRVARSSLELLKRVGIEIAICAPVAWQGRTAKDTGATVFDNLEDAMGWATVLVGLRVQNERHSEVNSGVVSEFVKRFQISKSKLKDWKPDGLVLHPGPVNWDVELTEDVSQDPRCRILKQVEAGVRVRAALLLEIGAST